MSPKLSFAIATYNRCDMVLNLVKEILSIERDDIEVVVVDDCSNDSTYKIISCINDKRLRIFRHDRNLNGKKTWFDAYELSLGDWIYYINDRDWINIKYIPKLISVLDELATHNVGFADAWLKCKPNTDTNYQIFNEGFETIREFGFVDQHPTGIIFRRKCWNEISNRKDFYYQDYYGIYPQGFVEALIGNRYKGAYILFDISDREHYSDRIASMGPSGIYRDSKGDEYFFPHKKFGLLKLLVENLYLVENQNQMDTLVLERCEKWFWDATVGYFYMCRNEVIKRRYEYYDLMVNFEETQQYGQQYFLDFKNIMKEANYCWADDSFYEELVFMEKRLIISLSEWISLRKNEVEVNRDSKIIVYGAGANYYNAIESVDMDKIICICDNDHQKEGKYLNGKKIIPLQKCLELLDANTVFFVTVTKREMQVEILKLLHGLNLKYVCWK